MSSLAKGSGERQVQTARLRKIPIGDMKTPVVVHSTDITAPTVGVDFGREITPLIEPWFCKVTTLRGVTVFDGSNIEQFVTHEFAGRFDDRIDEKMFIELSGKYYRIENVEVYEETQMYTVLLCTERGDKNLEVNEA